ncbi:MAG TPA: Ku protein [Methylomirabilota bacterium]|nr:Ku protein [Methylomirabilota bacterium]
MSARPLGSGTIALGLVAIPVRLYPAAVSRRVSFHMLHAKCGSRVRTQWFCPVCHRVVGREELVRGYEVSKGRFVRMSEDEMEALVGPRSREIELMEFVPLESVDPVYLDEAYFLGPDRGGARPYRLLETALTETGRVGIAHFMLRGKASLVLIRAASGVLMLHTMYYADEVRDAPDVERGAVKPAEQKLARRLIDELARPRYEASRHHDEFRTRVLQAIRRKAAGKAAAVAAPPAPRGKVIDLMDALQQSLERGGRARGSRARAAAAKARKGVSPSWRSSRAASAGRASTRSAS